MGCDEVRYQVLFFARLLAEFLKQGFEFIICTDAWLHHFIQWPSLCVLRGNFQVTANMKRRPDAISTFLIPGSSRALL